MIRIPGDPQDEVRLLQKAKKRLRAHHQANKDYALLSSEAIRNAKLPKADLLKLRILHRQFAGDAVPGLASAVSAGRFLLRSWRKVRGRA